MKIEQIKNHLFRLFNYVFNVILMKEIIIVT